MSDPVVSPGSDLETRVADPTSFALDSYVDLLAEVVECGNMIEWWQARQKLVKDRLRDLLGENEIGTVNGQEVIFYQKQNRFNSTAFRRKYPNLYRAFEVAKTETKFDPDLLKVSRPDLYEEFQVRAMRVTYEPPGGKK